MERRATAEEVNKTVQKELDTSGTNLEYCRIWASLKEQRFHVRKEDVRKTIIKLNCRKNTEIPVSYFFIDIITCSWQSFLLTSFLASISNHANQTCLSRHQLSLQYTEGSTENKTKQNKK